MKTLSSKSAKCAETMLEYLSSNSGISTATLNQHLKSIGFGDTAISKSKDFLLQSGQITRLTKAAAPWQWFLMEYAPTQHTGKKEQNYQRLLETYKYFPTRSSARSGCFVYALKRDRDGIVKIGASINVYERAKTISHQCGSLLTLVDFLDCPSKKEAEAIESYIHSLLEEHNLIGEWFDIDAETFSISSLLNKGQI